MELTREILNELLEYNPITGDLIWKTRDAKYFKNGLRVNSWNTRYAGTKIRVIDNKGYYFTSIFKKQYRAHRLIWLMNYGCLPKFIDHINGDKLDNRLCNLRAATNQDNSMNRAKARNNTSGVTGVYLNKRNGLWCAQIKHNGHTRHLGSSKSIDDVIKLRKAEERRLGFSERHGK